MATALTGSNIESLPGVFAVLTNSDPSGCGSFIKNRDHSNNKKATYGTVANEGQNKILLRTWSELD